MRTDIAIVKTEENQVKVLLYQKDYNYDDELEYFKIGEAETNFTIGCFEIEIYNLKDEIATIEEIIEKTKKRIEELESSKWDESESILFEREYLEYLREEKRKIEEAESVNEIKIEYSMCHLRIIVDNDQEIDIDNDREILFKNIKIKIEKY